MFVVAPLVAAMNKIELNQNADNNKIGLNNNTDDLINNKTDNTEDDVLTIDDLINKNSEGFVLAIEDIFYTLDDLM